ncbi:MAG: type II toxin-antitoxin system RelE/ParE family toxin [Candidatus Electrothrix sp. Rat3]|nr:type II toxin-antitoxin system RelE/ParE family toxin [Candidatus Electrothrix rattekaaiensis]
MPYEIEFRPAVLKTLKRFPKRDLVRIKKKIEETAENLPNPDLTKMKGKNDFHKVRSGNYRIIYTIEEDRLVILIVKIGHRKDVYRNLA